VALRFDSGFVEILMYEESPFDGSSFDRARRQVLVEWWTQLELDGDCGVTNWSVLDPIRDAVPAYLGFSPPQLDKAEYLTAKAIRLITGEEKS